MKTLKELIQQEQGRWNEVSKHSQFIDHSLFKAFLAEAMTTTAKAVGELVPPRLEPSFAKRVFAEAVFGDEATTVSVDAYNLCSDRIALALKTFLGEV